MRRLDIRPQADDDLDAHALYIARDSVDAALRFYDSASRTFRELLRQPGKGALVEEVPDRLHGLRRCAIQGFPNHVAYYLTSKTRIDVVRVLHGAQDRDSIIRHEPS